ncbi:MucR family transcriptional regulator [Caulobacter endophyticus]|uniref:MucR family transcriptional regulator n=1 Tax=Caulobacter endophyticus TaxID=2172652 RepID=UPI00240EE100|nr:MucR family transcriptional regulator [Caulobacter endophyticus]MDG2531282.1 MucR family transcriptional regulator [Caulobacter endophyticus]
MSDKVRTVVLSVEAEWCERQPVLIPREGDPVAEQDKQLVALTAEVVAAYVGNNAIGVADIPALVRSIHDALAGAGAPVEAEAVEVTKPTAAQIRKSVTPDALISFIDGKAYKTLKRHLTTQGLTIAEYKARYGLPQDYPTTAPSYSEARSAMAKALGLGQSGRKSAKPAAKPKAAAKGRAKT